MSGELPTQCTPSTIKTTVEALERVPIQEPREEKQGGSGGKEEKPPGAVSPGWARALLSSASCQLGRCAFADPTRPPNRYLAGVGCDGYHATEHIDAEGVVTVRWYLCHRHREWWRHERIRRAAVKKGA